MRRRATFWSLDGTVGERQGILDSANEAETYDGAFHDSLVDHNTLTVLHDLRVA